LSTVDFTLYDLIARNAAVYADREALIGSGERLTFAAFLNRCAENAAALRAAGLGAGERIALLAGNELSFLCLCGAAAGLGAMVVPVNWRLGGEEIAYILNDTTPRFLFCGADFRELARQAAAGVPSLERRFLLRGSGRRDDIAEGGTGAEDSENGDFQPWPAVGVVGDEKAVSGGGATWPPMPAGSGADPFLIIHTAAVGGRPRGCVLSQDNLMAAAAQLVTLFRLESRDAYVGVLPLFHIGGLAMTLATMLAGGKNILTPRFEPPEVLRLAADEGGTCLMTFPPMLSALLDAEEQGRGNAAGLRLVGGVDAPATIERFLQRHPRAAFFSIYGQTEAMPVSGGDYRERPGSVGRPAALTRVAVCNDLEEEVPPGTPGEICVRSPAVFQGYWNLAQEAAVAARSGWHHTGDLGRWDAEGFLWYAGRKPEKELIKTGGENVYPVEVEQTILAHAAVAEVCVFGVPDPEWGETVRAVCVLKEGAAVSEEELGKFVADRIARYKKPKTVVFAPALPKTPAGNIDREAVKKTWGGES